MWKLLTREKTRIESNSEIEKEFTLMRPPGFCLEFPIAFYKIFSAVSEEKILQNKYSSIES